LGTAGAVLIATPAFSFCCESCERSTALSVDIDGLRSYGSGYVTDLGIGRNIVMLPEGSGASLETLGPLKRAIDNGSGDYTAAAIFPTQRVMHREIKGPKALSALRWTPHRYDSHSRNKPLHEIGRGGSGT
jgi:hypothetical protein